MPAAASAAPAPAASAAPASAASAASASAAFAAAFAAAVARLEYDGLMDDNFRGFIRFHGYHLPALISYYDTIRIMSTYFVT